MHAEAKLASTAIFVLDFAAAPRSLSNSANERLKSQCQLETFSFSPPKRKWFSAHKTDSAFHAVSLPHFTQMFNCLYLKNCMFETFSPVQGYPTLSIVNGGDTTVPRTESSPSGYKYCTVHTRRYLLDESGHKGKN